MKFDSRVWLCWWILYSMWTRSESLSNTCDTFYLLNLYPAPDESNSTGYDGGFELIPAGHLATQHINSDSSILQGHKIELINVPTEACGQTVIIEGLANYHEQILNPDGVCIYGIVGLYCSTVTNVIAPIANHPYTGHVQLAASTSPVHRNVTKFPYTFYTLSSTRVLNKAVVEIMDVFNWRIVTSIFNPLSVFHRSNVDDFKTLASKLVGNNATITPIPMLPFLPTSEIFTQRLPRISYITASDNDLAEFFCEAYRKGFHWPNYAYIVVEKSFEGIRSQSNCSVEDLTKALEGTFLLQYKFHIDNSSEIELFGHNYTQYLKEYMIELERFAEETKTSLNADETAELLYDQVWAFALALNMSLDDINILNSSISQGNLKDRAFVRETLAKNMKDIEFIGASGTVRFGEENEVFTPVEIYQIQNGKEVLVGTYDSFNKTIDFISTFNKTGVPSDKFDTQFVHAPQWLGILVIIASIAILLLTLFNTVATILLKKKPEIKSGSFSLSLVILLGCGIHSTSPIFATVLATKIPSMPAFTLVCNLELWTFFLGIVIILAALFMRLLRIYNIFRPYNYTGKYWSDKYLLLYITLICSIMIALLIIWAAVDLYEYDFEQDLILEVPPYHRRIDKCTSDHLGIWLALTFSFIGCIMLLLVFFAIQTRHVQIKDFKDTKKVNMFIFCVCIVYAIFMPLWVVLSNLGYRLFTAAYVCQSITILAGPALCQLFLLLPKTIPAIINSQNKRETLTTLVHFVHQSL